MIHITNYHINHNNNSSSSVTCNNRILRMVWNDSNITTTSSTRHYRQQRQSIVLQQYLYSIFMNLSFIITIVVTIATTMIAATITNNILTQPTIVMSYTITSRSSIMMSHRKFMTPNIRRTLSTLNRKNYKINKLVIPSPKCCQRSSRTISTLLQARTSIHDIDSSNTIYDVIVIGGGHAGCEAAAASARTGAQTLLVTQRIDTIGELSCNPSIGGIGKGHIVREIDALQGVMGIVADHAGIHYRILNAKKGPAVRGPRAQMDRDLYKQAMQSTLLGLSSSTSSDYNNLHILEASVDDLLLDESQINTVESLAPFGITTTTSTTAAPQQQQVMIDQATKAVQGRKARIRGVVVTIPTTSSSTSTVVQDNVHDASATSPTEMLDTKLSTTRHEVMGRTVIITTGTFLRGVLMVGHDRYSGGRHLRDSECVEPPSNALAETLQRLQFPLSRLKTGTPARIDGNTIDYSACAIQPTDNPAIPFSHVLQFRNEQPYCLANNKFIDCYQTATNEETHELVMKYEHTLPKYDGLDGKGNGPRYCPSIYKKVQRFPDRTGHNCFLEPEGLNTNIVYPNGMSGPYPPEIQQKILRTMKGLGAVEIIRPGYDVEYDFVNPICLTHTLETKVVGGLYLAGQICGTTGYEEAAAQGIVAGANAGRTSLAASNNEAPPTPFIIGRDEGYIGVLIDDLVTRGTMEPYRMFTSRAEYRITLRADNADLRLTSKGIEYGLVYDEERIDAMERRSYMIEQRVEQLRKFDMKVTEWASRGNNLMGGEQMDRKIGQKKTAEEVLSMPHITLKEVEDIIISIQQEEKAKEDETSTDSIDDVYYFNNDNDSLPDMTPSPNSVYDTIEATVKYNCYIRRQHKDMESWRRAQGLRIPPNIVYDRDNLPTFSLEELEKLNAVRPNTFAEASQISGITPQSLVYLYHRVMRRNTQKDRRRNEQKELNSAKSTM